MPPDILAVHVPLLPAPSPQTLTGEDAEVAPDLSAEGLLAARPADAQGAGAPKAEGADVPVALPVTPGLKPWFGLSQSGEDVPRNLHPTGGEPSSALARSDTPVSTTMPGQGQPDRGQSPAPDTTIRLGNPAALARKTSAQGAAALSFALRSAPDMAGDAGSEPPLVAAMQPDPTGVAAAASASLHGLAPDGQPDQGDEISAAAGLAGLPPNHKPASAHPPASALTAHSLPASLGHEVSTLLQSRPDGPVEISLSPDELGKLRVSLWQDGSGLRVMVQAERSETLELLRRNSDHLMQEIRESGFSGGSLSFGQWGGPPDRPGSPSRSMEPDGAEAAPAPLASPHPPLRAASSSNLDLRY